MRILLASDYYPPFIGGGQRWAQLLARGLHEAGQEVVVVTARSGGQGRIEDDEGWPVYRLSQLRTWPARRVRDREQRQLPPFPDPVAVHQARQVIAVSRPEICIAYGWITMNVLGPCVERDVPVVLSAHDYGSFCATRTLLEHGRPCSGSAFGKCLSCATDFYGPGTGVPAAVSLFAAQPRFRRHIAAIHSVSTYVDGQNARFVGGRPGMPDETPRYVIPAFLLPPDPPSSERLTELQPYIDQLPSEPFIFFAGALRKLKGVDVLLSAYAQLRSPRPPLVLMGAPYADTPTNLPSGVRIVESAPHGAVMHAFKHALMAVFPSVWPEPLGTVAMEAISVGCPAIASRPSGMEDVLADGVGILVERGSVDELRAAMQQLIDEPAARDRFREAGMTASSRFGYRETIDRYVAAFQEILGDRRPPVAS